MTANKLLMRFASQYPILIFLTILLGLSSGIFNGISTVLIVPLLLTFVGQELVSFKGGPQFLQTAVSWFDNLPGETRLIAMFLCIILAIILKNVTIYLNTIVASYLSRNLVNGIRLEAIKMLLDVDLDFYSKNKIGDIVNQISQEVGRTASALRILIAMCSQVITVSIFVFILISLSWQLTLISVLLLSLIAFGNQVFVSRSRKFGKILSENSKKYSNKLFEILTGIRLIKTVGQENFEYQHIEQAIKEREKAEFDAQCTTAFISPFNEVASIFAVLIMVILSRNIFFADNLQAFSTILLTYLVLLFRLLPMVSQLNNSRANLSNVSYSTEILAEFLRKDNKPLMSYGKEIYGRLQKGIEFVNVSFSYPDHDSLVLDNINLLIPKGQTIALVGSSGAGKSTIADLVPRFYDVTGGVIKIDGIDIKDFDLKSLRKAMGIVSQDTFLFNNSLRYNIAYGMENVTDNQVIAAAKRANAYEFISRLPQGLDTEIGDRGVMLSGGQRQRIAIARALLRDPDVLILDEATSALDTVSERLVQQAIDELCRDRTTLVIAHRLSTVQKADRIVVLDQGKIVEIGNHQELLAKNGYYSRLYSMQFGDQSKSRINLPTNEALLRASIRASYELRNRVSYEARNRLNTMLGSLRLVNDGLIDSPQEKYELIEESYNAAIYLLNTIESFEDHVTKLKVE